MTHQVTFEFPWMEEAFIQQNHNIYDMIDEKIARLTNVFPKARVLSKQIQPREWIEEEKAFLNRVKVVVSLGDPDTDLLTKGFK